MIDTENLQLITVKPIHIEAFARGKSELATVLQVAVPKQWPHFPEALTPDANKFVEFSSPSTHWHGYLFIHPTKKALIGNGGFKGPPDKSGTVEIGYEIADEFHNLGFGTEAAQGLINYAFAQEEVKAVMAHTLAGKNASNSVLKKVGMEFISEIDSSGLGKIWRWQINRKKRALI